MFSICVYFYRIFSAADTVRVDGADNELW